MVGTSLSLGRPCYSFLFRCLSDLCALCFLLECLWLEEGFSPESLPPKCDFFGVMAAVQEDERVLLHVQGAPQQCKADVPEAESLMAGHHVLGQRLWTLEVVQEMFKVEYGHPQEEKIKRSMWMQMQGYECLHVKNLSDENKVEGLCTYLTLVSVHQKCCWMHIRHVCCLVKDTRCGKSFCHMMYQWV